MKTDMIPAREDIAAIHGAFHGAGSCHCHTVAKLGEDDILAYLARRKLVSVAEVIEIQSLSIVAITQRYEDLVIPHNAAWALRRAGVTLLSDLTNWTYADVLRLDHMSRRSVDKLQEGMAQFGLLLKGGDPALLERPPTPEPEPEEPYDGPARSPEEIRKACHEALTKVANSVMRDGTSLIRIASSIAGGQKRAAVLRRYIGDLNQSRAREVATIIRPLLELEASETEQAKAEARKQVKTKKKRTVKPAAVETQGNVVRAAFGR